jgi:hypothetical protein
MWPFSKKEKSGELALVFDISSSSLGGSVFYIENSGSPRIIYTSREPILIKEDLDFNSFFALTISSLEKLVERIHNEKIGKSKQ